MKKIFLTLIAICITIVALSQSNDASFRNLQLSGYGRVASYLSVWGQSYLHGKTSVGYSSAFDSTFNVIGSSYLNGNTRTTNLLVDGRYSSGSGNVFIGTNLFMTMDNCYQDTVSNCTNGAHYNSRNCKSESSHYTTIFGSVASQIVGGSHYAGIKNSNMARIENSPVSNINTGNFSYIYGTTHATIETGKFDSIISSGKWSIIEGSDNCKLQSVGNSNIILGSTGSNITSAGHYCGMFFCDTSAITGGINRAIMIGCKGKTNTREGSVMLPDLLVNGVRIENRADSVYEINADTTLKEVLSTVIYIISHTAGNIDLDSIADASDGTVIELWGTNDTRTVTVNDTPYLNVAGGVSFTLGNGDVISFRRYRGNWYERFRSNN